jgi:hypothetical protein
MRCNPRNASGFRVGREHLPDSLFAQRVRLNVIGSIYCPEDASILQIGCTSPCIYGHLHPCGHGYRANSLVLADKINDAPPAISLLEMRECERRYLGPSQPAT